MRQKFIVLILCPTMGACKDRKFSAIDFKTKATAGEIQTVLTITMMAEFSWGVFPSIIIIITESLYLRLNFYVHHTGAN